MEAATDLSTQALLERLRSDLGELASRGRGFRQSDDLIAVLEATPRLRAQVDALTVQVTTEVDRWGLAKDAGYRTVEQMVADRTGADGEKVHADLRLGKWLDDFDELAQAFGVGDLFREHLELIRRSIHNPRTRATLIRDQELFVEAATDLDFVDFGRSCGYWKNVNDPDGVEPKEQIAATYFKARKDGNGCLKVDGFLDPLMGDAFMTMYEHEDQKLFRASFENEEVFGPYGTQPKNITGQRGARALMNLMRRGFARADGTFPKPLINVVASEAVIEDCLERLANPSDDPLPLAFDDIDKRCELIDGTPLHPAYLLAVLGLATFRRQILTAAGRTADLSVDARCFTPLQKQVLLVEARGRCTSPGCSSPFAWLEADHLHPHSKGGPTETGNGGMKCKPDNQAKGDGVAQKPAA